VQTANRWGIAVSKDRPDTLADIDGALGRLIDSGRLQQVWTQHLPTLDYPF
jgi:polar amino acid transport system substrate-binding protein